MRQTSLILIAMVAGAVPVSDLAAQGLALGPIEARVWLDRGTEPVLHSGDRVRVFYRTNQDAYVSVFHIDTDGRTRLVFPSAPGVPHYVRGGRDYRVPFAQRDYWRVQDFAGVGYFFIVASPTPFDFGAIPHSAYGGWNLTRVGSSVYGDPFVAMDDYVSYLIPDWEYASYALDFSLYNVQRRYEYPRFLCYDCHRYRSFSSWNPYLSACNSFRVVIYTDPYYYPAYRYRANQVGYTRPVVARQPQFGFKELARGESSRPLRTARPKAVVVNGGTRAVTPNGQSSARTRSGAANGSVGASGGAVTRPIRPGVTASDPAARTTTATPRRGRPTEAIQGRTGSRTGGAQRGATVRPGSTAGSSAVRPGTSASGRSGSATRPGATVRPGATTRPGATSVRPGGGSTGTARPPGTSGATARPPTRPGGGAVGSSRPGTSSRPGGVTVRPPTRPGGGSVGSSRPTTSSGASSRPPTRPPARPKVGGSVGSTGRGGSSGVATRPPTRPTRPGATGRGGG